jgi:hypothetical protein
VLWKDEDGARREVLACKKKLGCDRFGVERCQLLSAKIK